MEFETVLEIGKANSAPPLAADGVHVWKVDLDVPAGSPDSLPLSRDEVGRSLRYRFERDREHYVTCRTALRCLLSRYLGLPPEEIRFEYSSKGKPEVSPEQNAYSVRFNVSHSGSMALIAVGLKSSLGVDIEKVRSDVDITSLSQRYCSKRERGGLAAMSGELRERAFFACWTRKEAFLKATGFGLSSSLAAFTVSADPERPPRIEEIAGNERAGEAWFLSDVPVPAGYRAAVAVEAPSRTLSIHPYLS